MPSMFRRSLSQVVGACLLLGLSVLPAARAVQVTPFRAACPLDGAETRMFEKVSNDTHGGYDSDLCDYSTSGQWRTYALSTCPEDLFTLYGRDFLEPRDEATLARLKEEAARVKVEYPDPDKLEAWDRYAIAARFYRALGKDEAFLGEVYLQGSWVARDAAVGTYAGLSGPRTAVELLEKGALELDKPLTPAQRKSVLFNLARVAHRAGEGALRDRYLDQFEKVGSLTDVEVSTLRTVRRIVTEVEPRMQDLAITSFQAFLAHPPSGDPRVVQCEYVLADLYRRRGRTGEALELYDRVAGTSGVPASLKDMATFLAGRIRAGAGR